MPPSSYTAASLGEQLDEAPNDLQENIGSHTLQDKSLLIMVLSKRKESKMHLLKDPETELVQLRPGEKSSFSKGWFSLEQISNWNWR